VHFGNRGKRGNHPLGLGIKDKDLTGTQMGDKEPVRHWVQTLIIEARGISRQGDVCHDLQGQG
jgi:hypothetical protein